MKVLKGSTRVTVCMSSRTTCMAQQSAVGRKSGSKQASSRLVGDLMNAVDITQQWLHSRTLDATSSRQELSRSYEEKKTHIMGSRKLEALSATMVAAAMVISAQAWAGAPQEKVIDGVVYLVEGPKAAKGSGGFSLIETLPYFALVVLILLTILVIFASYEQWANRRTQEKDLKEFEPELKQMGRKAKLSLNEEEAKQDALVAEAQ